jgi:CubicO group peptidase (beta-lactamase class C family)
MVGPTLLKPAEAAGMAPVDTVTAADQRLIEALADYIPHVMRLTGAPGLNLAVARRGRIIWEAGFGVADLATATPMTAGTVAHSGSMAKVYTSVAALQLVDRGAIALDGPINDYLKGLKVENPLGDRPITVRDLLTHTSGLNENAAGSMYRRPPALADHVRDGYAKATFRSYRGSWLPRWGYKVGAQFSYSNFGMATLGLVVEQANPDGLSFSDYMIRHVIEPLGMASTQFPPVQAAPAVRQDLIERFSTGYAALGHVVVPTPTIYLADFPAGTVVTTPGDHIRLLMMIANGGRWGEHQVLQPRTAAAMVTQGGDPASALPDPPRLFGLGLLLADPDTPSFSFGHGGAHMFGWVNDFRACPGLDFAYAVFTNHWTILPTRTNEATMIGDFIKSWVRNEIGGVEVERGPEQTNRAWQTSYVAGLVLTEQLMGLLGIEEALSDEAVARLADEARIHLESANASSGWNPDAFRQGCADMAAVPMTIEDLRQAAGDGRFKVSADDLVRIGREFGLPGSPILMSVDN